MTDDALPTCSRVGSVSIEGETAVFELETLDGRTVELAIEFDALPDLAMGVAAVLQQAVRVPETTQ